MKRKPLVAKLILLFLLPVFFGTSLSMIFLNFPVYIYIIFKFMTVTKDTAIEDIPLNTDPKTREYDFVFYGATGCTGQFLQMYVRYLYQKKDKVKVALAGRSIEKLHAVRNKYLSEFKDQIDVIEANANNHQSLVSMCNRTKVVLNTVGPYQLYGEPIVKACIATSTFHVDITGETFWVDKMTQKYNQAAIKNKSILVSYAGFDSVPMVYNLNKLHSNYQAKFNAEPTFMRTIIYGGGQGAGPSGTIETMFAALGSLQESVHKIDSYDELVRVNCPIFIEWDYHFHCYVGMYPFTYNNPHILGMMVQKDSTFKYNKSNPLHYSEVVFYDDWYFTSLALSLAYYTILLLLLNPLTRYVIGLLIRRPSFLPDFDNLEKSSTNLFGYATTLEKKASSENKEIVCGSYHSMGEGGLAYTCKTMLLISMELLYQFPDNKQGGIKENEQSQDTQAQKQQYGFRTPNIVNLKCLEDELSLVKYDN